MGATRPPIACGQAAGAVLTVQVLVGVHEQDFQGRREPVNRLLNRAIIKQCPTEIQGLLTRPGLPPSFGECVLP